MSFGSRIKQRREELGLTQGELGRMLGVRGSAIGNYENGVSSPKADVLYQLFNVLRCDANYLFQDSADAVEYPACSPAALSLARDYDELDEYGQRVVRTVTDIEAERCRAAKPRTSKFPRPVQRDDGFTELRVFDQRPAAGLGNYLDDTSSHVEQYPSENLPAGTDFGVTVGGDSMEPAFPDCSVAFVHATEDVRDGDIILCAKNGEGYIKQLFRRDGQTFLHSLNDAYRDIAVSDCDAFRTFGKVIGCCKPK